MASCFGRCQPASVAPVKRYNILVPDVFPRTSEPDSSQPISEATKKKIKKLWDYVEHNPERIPKVSRRLMRRITKELYSGRMGNVRIGVHAYIYLLDNSPERDISLYAKELVLDHPSLTEKLLDNKNIVSRILAAELFALFVKRQSNAEYLEQIDAAVVKMCACAARHPPPDISSNTPDKLNELRIACMHSLRENIKFAARISMVPRHLELIETCVLDNLVVSEAANRQGQAGASKTYGLKSVASLDIKFTQEMVKNHVVGEAAPDEIAKEVLSDMGNLLKDLITGSRVLQYWLNYLDAGHHWTQGSVLQISIEYLTPQDSEPHRQYQLVTALIRHINSPSMVSQNQIALLNIFIGLAPTLSATFVVSVLVQLLRELPQVLLECSRQEEKGVDNNGKLREVIESAVYSISRRLEDGQQLLEVICGLLEKAVANGDQQQGLLTLKVCYLAVQKFNVAAISKGGRSSLQYLPHSLVRSLGIIISQWSRQSGMTAIRLVCALTPMVSGGLRDTQVMQLLSIVYYALESPTSTPDFFVHLSMLMHAVLTSGSIGVTAINSAKLTKKIAREAVLWEMGRLCDIGAVRAIAVLALCNSIVSMMGKVYQADMEDNVKIQLDNTHPQLKLSSKTGELEIRDAKLEVFDEGIAALCKAKLNTLAGKEKSVLEDKLAVKLSKSAILKKALDSEHQIISQIQKEDFKPVRTSGQTEPTATQMPEQIASSVASMGSKGMLEASESFKQSTSLPTDYSSKRSQSNGGISTVSEEKPEDNSNVSPLEIALQFSKSVLDAPQRNSQKQVSGLLSLDMPSGLSQIQLK